MTIAAYFAYACNCMTYFWRKQESQADLTYQELIGLWILIQDVSLEWNLEVCSLLKHPFWGDFIFKRPHLKIKLKIASFLSNNTDWIMQWKCVLISFDFMLSYIVLCPSENFQGAQNISYTHNPKSIPKKWCYISWCSQVWAIINTSMETFVLWSAFFWHAVSKLIHFLLPAKLFEFLWFKTMHSMLMEDAHIWINSYSVAYFRLVPHAVNCFGAVKEYILIVNVLTHQT